MRDPVRRSQLGIRSQPIGHLPHRTASLAAAHQCGQPPTGQVVEGRKWGAVFKAGMGLNHAGQPAGAAVRDSSQRTRWAAQLCGDGLLVGGRHLRTEIIHC
jgi:hypothetical protein